MSYMMHFTPQFFESHDSHNDQDWSLTPPSSSYFDHGCGNINPQALLWKCRDPATMMEGRMSVATSQCSPELHLSGRHLGPQRVDKQDTPYCALQMTASHHYRHQGGSASGCADNVRSQHGSRMLSPLSLAESDRKRMLLLQRNRVAAAKCRTKRKQWINELEQAAREREKQYQDLSDLVGALANQIVDLKNRVEECRCQQHEDVPTS